MSGYLFCLIDRLTYTADCMRTRVRVSTSLFYNKELPAPERSSALKYKLLGNKRLYWYESISDWRFQLVVYFSTNTSAIFSVETFWLELAITHLLKRLFAVIICVNSVNEGGVHWPSRRIKPLIRLKKLPWEIVV